MRIRIIDAFTGRPFAGNPAAVCLLDNATWPDEGWMQQVAAEMNLSETAFAHPLPENTDADWALRWFTPTVEVDLCGHATLATAHALREDRATPGSVRFRTRSGVLITHTHDDGTITLDFPTAPTIGAYDFVSRFFAPAVGIAEDPVTGSAHTALALYWSARLGRDNLTGLQASTRTGLIRTAVHGERVHLTGHAVTVLDGILHHTP